MARETGAKLLYFKRDQLIKLIKATARDEILIPLAERTRRILRERVPVDTGNLKENQIIGDIAEVGDTMGVVVGTDHDEAPYDVHVFFPGITRNYAGNDWITPTITEIESRKGQILREGAQALGRIRI